jgi:Helix-turn-helix domain
MPTVAHLSSTPQASREREAEGSWARSADRRRVFLLYQPLQPAPAASATAWAIHAAPAPWGVCVHLEGLALYTLYAVDEAPSCCAEPPATYQVRSLQAGHWYWLNNVVIDHHARFLGPEALALYACLARHADNITQECWPTIPRMEQSTGMSRNRVRKALKRLAAYGLITLEERVIPHYGKVWRGYLITLLDPNPLAVSLRQPPGEQIPPPHGGTRRRRQGRAVTSQP